MKPHEHSHQESGENYLIGVALIEAWDRRDNVALEALIGTEPSDMRSAVIGACRAATTMLHLLAWQAAEPTRRAAFELARLDARLDDFDFAQYERAVLNSVIAQARVYGLMRRDHLDGISNQQQEDTGD